MVAYSVPYLRTPLLAVCLACVCPHSCCFLLRETPEASIWPWDKPRLPYVQAFVINRGTDASRLQHFNTKAARAGVHAQRFPAVDKDTMDPDVLVKTGAIEPHIAKRIHDLPQVRGAYACTLSHNYLWRQLAQMPDNDVFLIFEDDSSIPWFFHQKLASVLAWAPVDWDLLYLNHNILAGHRVNTLWLQPDKEYPGKGKNALMNAYLVKPIGLRKLLSFQHPISFNCSKDDNMRRHFKDFNAYFLIEPLVTQDPSLPSVRVPELKEIDTWLPEFGDANDEHVQLPKGRRS